MHAFNLSMSNEKQGRGRRDVLHRGEEVKVEGKVPGPPLLSGTGRGLCICKVVSKVSRCKVTDGQTAANPASSTIRNISFTTRCQFIMNNVNLICMFSIAVLLCY